MYTTKMGYDIVEYEKGKKNPRMVEFSIKPFEYLDLIYISMIADFYLLFKIQAMIEKTLINHTLSDNRKELFVACNLYS